MKKWLIRIAVCLLSVFLLLCTALFFLLGTQSGTNLIVSQIQEQMDGQLGIASATGTLLGRLEINGLHFHNATGKTELGKLVLDWKSSDLLRLNLHILEIYVSDISHTVIPQAQDEEAETETPLSLPELTLPITMRVEKLNIHNFSFLTAPGADPLIVQDATLALLWDTKGIQLQKLTVRAEEAKLQIQGHLLPTGDYPLRLASVIEIRSPNYPSLTLHGDYEGDLQKLQFKEVLRGDMHADAQGTLKNILGDLAWDIALNWQKLQWPISGKPEYSSEAGNAKLTGDIDDFHLTLNAAVSGDDIPEAEIQLSADGNSEHARNIQLAVQTLDGQIDITGGVDWTPLLEWQLHTKAEHVNPGIHYSDWPGHLDWSIKSDGRIAEQKVFTNVRIEHLQGILREYPIKGTGEIKVKPDTILVDALHLSSGKATISAQGTLGEESDLQWNIDIGNFSDILPNSSGQIHGTGTVRGDISSPNVTSQLSGKSIVIPQLALQEIQASADIDFSSQKPFTLNLKAINLKTGDNLIRKISLRADGHLDQHTAKLFASHELADMSLALQGKYKDQQWQGYIDALSLDSHDIGLWKTEGQSKLTASPKAATMDTLCLERGKSSVCLDAAWDADNTKSGGRLSLAEFPLNWFSAWFPEPLEDLGGILFLEADVIMQKQLKVDAKAHVTPGKMCYLTDKRQGTLPHEGMKLDLQIADNGLATDIWISVDSNIISGTLKSPNLLSTATGASPKLDGSVTIDAENFTLVETLVADIKELKAKVDSGFTIQGTVAQPKINGKGQLHINHILIPIAGLELSDTTLDILADNSNLQIKGIFNSPKGSMALKGSALIDAEANYPARISLKGDNFRLVNLPDIKIFLTSDLLFEKNKELSRLTGNITIPKAEVLLRELPVGTATISPDVIIIQEEKEKAEKSPLQMKLKIALGQKVHFVGLGLNAFIDGQLSLTAEPDEQMMGSGEFHIKEGLYRAYGQDLDIETGVISFPGGPLTQPGINLRATRTVGDVVAGIYAIGPASKPRITTFSRPPMSEGQTLSYLITGSAPTAGGSGTSLSIGRQINNKLSVSVGTHTKTGESEFITKYRLGRKVHVQTTTGTSSNAADIFYSTELGEEKEEQGQE